MQNEENCKGSVVFTHVHRHSILKDLNLLERFHSYPLEMWMLISVLPRSIQYLRGQAQETLI